MTEHSTPGTRSSDEKVTSEFAHACQVRCGDVIVFHGTEYTVETITTNAAHPDARGFAFSITGPAGAPTAINDGLPYWYADDDLLSIIRADQPSSLSSEPTPGCQHEHVRTFRSYPPHSKCLDCGARVVQQWVAELSLPSASTTGDDRG